MTPRGAAQQAWLTPREPGGACESSLKSAGIGLLGPRVPKLQLPRYDAAPGVRPAGKAFEPDDASVLLPAPRTPENLGESRLRHRLRTGPGEISVHWGLKGAKIPLAGNGFGRPSCKDDSVAHIFRAGQRLGVAEYFASVGEAVYESTTKEPLGKSWCRGHRLPAQTQDCSFPGFGKPCVMNEPAKLAIFPRDQALDSEETKAMYKKTHQSFAPGESIHREYEWPKSVRGNTHHCFGKAETKDSNHHGLGVKCALTMDRRADEPHSSTATRLVDIHLASFLEVSADPLGAGKCQLQTARRVPDDHRYGRSTATDGVSAAQLIHAGYPMEQQMPDEDLGRCTVQGRRNLLTARALGVPSVRDDIPPPMSRSIANSTNYGDDPDARGLIAPGKFQHKGLLDEDFLVKRSPEELLDILRSVHGGISHQDFDEIFARATELHGDGDATAASLEALMVAVSDWSTAAGRSLVPTTPTAHLRTTRAAPKTAR